MALSEAKGKKNYCLTPKAELLLKFLHSGEFNFSEHIKYVLHGIYYGVKIRVLHICDLLHILPVET